jgi:SAM-dependent methyltransferase
MMTELSYSMPPAEDDKAAYKAFWDWAGLHFPAFFKAPSTRYYLECEERLYETYFPGLAGRKLLKTDLWNEAKNTRILKYAADRGADIYGIDISAEMIRQTGSAFENSTTRRQFIVSDIRAIAFAEGSFDHIYSMGTIEHIKEHALAARECFRVLRKGGTAIIGVPNAHDPFFRPLMVGILQRLGLYAYGYERSFSMRALKRMLEREGFEVLAETGILFMPGWLRMADLWIYVRRPKLAFLSAPAVSFFAYLHRKFPRLGRHGYLIACVVRKP